MKATLLGPLDRANLCPQVSSYGNRRYRQSELLTASLNKVLINNLINNLLQMFTAVNILNPKWSQLQLGTGYGPVWPVSLFTGNAFFKMLLKDDVNF
jgi:hypothetical protein